MERQGGVSHTAARRGPWRFDDQTSKDWKFRAGFFQPLETLAVEPVGVT